MARLHRCPFCARTFRYDPPPYDFGFYGDRADYACPDAPHVDARRLWEASTIMYVEGGPSADRRYAVDQGAVVYAGSISPNITIGHGESVRLVTSAICE